MCVCVPAGKAEADLGALSTAYNDLEEHAFRMEEQLKQAEESAEAGQQAATAGQQQQAAAAAGGLLSEEQVEARIQAALEKVGVAAGGGPCLGTAGRLASSVGHHTRHCCRFKAAVVAGVFIKVLRQLLGSICWSTWGAAFGPPVQGLWAPAQIIQSKVVGAWWVCRPCHVLPCAGPAAAAGAARYRCQRRRGGG